MARPEKQGLDYFSHDVDLSTDEKIQLIEAEHGIVGYGIFCKILERIYRNGYYIECTEKFIKLLSKNSNIEIEKCRLIIMSCVNEDLFKRSIFDKYQVLTSRGIQTRYIEAINRRKKVNLIKEYLLVNVDGNSENVDIISINDGISTQSKVKESKVNKSIYRDFVFLTENEYKRLKKDFGNDGREKLIWELDNYIGQNPKKRSKKWTDHNRVLRGWVLEKLQSKGKIKHGQQEGNQGNNEKPKLCKKCKTEPVFDNDSGLCLTCGDYKSTKEMLKTYGNPFKKAFKSIPELDEQARIEKLKGQVK